MGHTHRIRFGVKLRDAASPAAWAEQARRAEALGYDAVLLPDHIEYGLAALPAALAAAQATTRLRVGTSVLCNDFRHPAVLAKEAAPIDWLSGGRFELGIGAGWMQEDHRKTGIPRDPAAVRIERLEEALIVLRGLFGGEPFSFDGTHYRTHELVGIPRPVQSGGPPLVVGGGGRRLLGVAGRHADIVSVNPRAGSGVHDAETDRDATAAAADRKLEWLREAAGERFGGIELARELYAVKLTDDRGAAERVLTQHFQLPEAEARRSPHGLSGSLDALCDTLEGRRERWGTSYWIVPPAAMDEMAALVERMTGA